MTQFSDDIAAMQRKLQHLDDKDQNKVTSAMVSAGMTPIAREQRREAPDNKANKRKEHKLKKAIGRRKKTKSRRIVSAKVGGNVGPAGKGSKRAYHFHLVGLGTKRRRTKKGADRGRMTANDFIHRGTSRAAPESKRKMVAKGEEKAAQLVQSAKSK